jgi:hypothetical protein
MTIKPGIKGALWMAPGAAIMLALILVVAHFQKAENTAEQLAFKARRVDLVNRMQLALSSASEAEKSAVLVITDRDSQTFADHARAATAVVERERGGLGELLKTGGTQGEKDLLAQFSQAFTEFQRVDADLLSLAVKNTNIKAYNLAFGPAAYQVRAMNAALSRIVAANADSPEAKRVMLLAFGAEIAVLRIETLLAPHIAEENDRKMDRVEALMAREDDRIRKDLDGLAAHPLVRGDSDLAQAASHYARFTRIRTQILALSRENTNVRSLAISLNEKRKVMLLCQATLDALRQAILDEPIAGVTYGRPAKPR